MTTLPLRAAAAHLGVSTDTLRKRLQRGLTPGRKVDGSWLVEVPDSPGHVPDNQDRPGPVPDTSAPPPGVLAVQRAEEMATYSHRLLAPYVAQIAEQAERIGRLEAELEQARAVPPATQSAAPESPERRPWWRWVWG